MKNTGGGREKATTGATPCFCGQGGTGIFECSGGLEGSENYQSGPETLRSAAGGARSSERSYNVLWRELGALFQRTGRAPRAL